MDKYDREIPPTKKWTGPGIMRIGETAPITTDDLIENHGRRILALENSREAEDRAIKSLEKKIEELKNAR